MDQFKSLKHITVELQNGLLIQDALVDAALHQKYAVLIESAHELLPPIDDFLDALDGVLEELKTILLMQVDLSQNHQ